MSVQSGAPALADLRGRLPELMLRDERRLRRRVDRARHVGDPEKQQTVLDEIAREVYAAEARIARRRASVPGITYPPELPVSAARDEVLDALRDAQIVIVAGETGSGKTTQLPKLLLETGRGVRGLIGHTQPRRIAARTVADRIASELGVDLGQQIGFQVRFTDQSTERTLVKVMTDGILLAEIQRDPLLVAYDTIVIDEAHERSLNIDFLLGYLAQLLPRRPDLQLVITSATIDLDRFAAHFRGRGRRERLPGQADGGPDSARRLDARVVEVSGRTYPVEVRYRPLADVDQPEAGERDPIQGITDAVEELAGDGPGDVLVFLSGEREIRDTADALRALELPSTEVLPLYARLSTAEQQRVFQPHAGRRVVLATNVAETSLTVPGVRYVVDPGTARISRYSNRTKVQRLPIEPVSRASADQRTGRCGRVADGICIRLYSQEDFEARPEYTDPEILRTNLASVILQMTALGLGDVAAFPFVDPPDARSVRDAVQLLHELGAVESAEVGPHQRLTEVGRTMAALPVDPRIARMIVEGDRNGCLREVLVIAAALSIQDPRERPQEHRHGADQLHARFADDSSDFAAYLNVWEYLREQQRELSSSAFRRRCKAEFLHHLRVREWQDLHGQLRSVAKDAGMSLSHTPAEPAAVHRSILAGFLSQVGLRQGESREYLGARSVKFTLWPGSALAAGPPSWVVAAELVETSRLWGRTAARIDPEWAERLAGHLVQRTHTEPRWSAKRGAAVVSEKVTLYGIPLVAARTVAYGPIDAGHARELFIRHALVDGEWRTHHEFLRANRRLLAELSDLEHRARRRDVAVDDETLHAFYDARIPADVVSGGHFDSWWKATRREQPDLLTFSRERLLDDAAALLDPRAYPDTWRQGDLALRVTYRFEPGAVDDGVTVHVPLATLNRVSAVGFDWQVPGLREELVIALMRGLPKPVRRSFVPVPDVARAALARMVPTQEPLVVALTRQLHRQTGVIVPRDAWAPGLVDEHLRVTFRVLDGDRVLAHGHDLAALQRELAGQVRVAVSQASGGLVRRGGTSWAFGTLPQVVDGVHGGHPVRGYPALVDEGPTVGVRVLLTPAEQRSAMWQGTRRLLLLAGPPPVRAVHGRLSNGQRLTLTRNPHGGVTALLDDCTIAAVDGLMTRHGGPAWDAAGFARLGAAVDVELVDAVLAIVGDVAGVLTAAHDVERLLDRPTSAALQPAVDDARAQLAALVHPGFVTATGRGRLADLVRYVRAIERRLQRPDAGRDRSLRARVAQVEDEYRSLRRRRPGDEALAEIPWMIQELRVSLFAQQLGTRYPVSEQRILRAMVDAVTASQ